MACSVSPHAAAYSAAACRFGARPPSSPRPAGLWTVPWRTPTGGREAARSSSASARALAGTTLRSTKPGTGRRSGLGPGLGRSELPLFGRNQIRLTGPGCQDARRLLPPELGDPVIVSRGVPGQTLGQSEDPLRHTQGQRQAAAPGAEVRLVQPDRVVGLEPHIYQRRSLQHPPAVTFACQCDRPLLRVRPAHVVVPELPELAVTVILAGKGYAVVTPRQQTAVLDQQRRMPGPRMGIAGQFRRPLHHLLRHMAVLTIYRPPLRLLLWLHAYHPFAAKTNRPPTRLPT